MRTAALAAAVVGVFAGAAGLMSAPPPPDAPDTKMMKKAEAPRPPAPPPIRLLIVTGRQSHDWRTGSAVLREFLAGSGRFRLDVIDDPEQQLTEERLAAADVIVLYYRSPRRWPAAIEHALTSAVRAGKGLVVLHGADSSFAGRLVDGKPVGDWPEYEEMIGGGRRAGFGAVAGPTQFAVQFAGATAPPPAPAPMGKAAAKPLVVRPHPITAGMTGFRHVPDELHGKLKMLPGNEVIAGAEHHTLPGGLQPVAWVRSHGSGRVFVTTLGHGLEPMRGAGYQTLVLRGAEWAATGKATIASPDQLDAPEEPRP